MARYIFALSACLSAISSSYRNLCFEERAQVRKLDSASLMMCLQVIPLSDLLYCLLKMFCRNELHFSANAVWANIPHQRKRLHLKLNSPNLKADQKPPSKSKLLGITELKEVRILRADSNLKAF